jgi:hypothetical protein
MAPVTRVLAQQPEALSAVPSTTKSLPSKKSHICKGPEAESVDRGAHREWRGGGSQEILSIQHSCAERWGRLSPVQRTVEQG